MLLGNTLFSLFTKVFASYEITWVERTKIEINRHLINNLKEQFQFVAISSTAVKFLFKTCTVFLSWIEEFLSYHNSEKNVVAPSP